MIDFNNVLALKAGTCDHTRLLKDMGAVARALLYKYKYPSHMVDDVVSESIIFLFTHLDRIPEDHDRLNSYLLALSRGFFRRQIFSQPTKVDIDEQSDRNPVFSSIAHEIGFEEDFEGMVNRVFKNLCFNALLDGATVKVPLHRVEDLTGKSSFRRLFMHTLNRVRYDKVDNIEEKITSRGSARPRRS